MWGVNARQVMEITHKLGGECCVWWGGREGYQSLFNTSIKRELDHLGKCVVMVGLRVRID